MQLLNVLHELGTALFYAKWPGPQNVVHVTLEDSQASQS